MRFKAECCSDQSNICSDDNNPCTKSPVCGADNSCWLLPDNNATCEVGGLVGHCEAGYCWNDTPAGNCDDGNICTDNITEDGKCVHDLVCQDGDYCTVDMCVVNPVGTDPMNKCEYIPIPGCCHVDSDCNDNDVCTQDFCNGATCEHDKLCLDGEPKMLTCEYDSDCLGSGFGDYCVASGEPGTPLKLCQECSGGGEQNECLPWELCFWGIGGNEGQYYSVFWCEDLVCESSADCDDKDPCTTDFCGMTECYHNVKEHCTHCADDNDCQVQSWCDNAGGGVLIQYANCETSGACQLDSWDFTVDVKIYGCEYPIECTNDADCPASDGTCILGTCYYNNNSGYPECAVDSDCFGTGACDFGAGKCVDYECYDGLPCPEGTACQNSQCIPVEQFSCQTDADCQGSNFVNGQYFCEVDMVTAEKHCYQCHVAENAPAMATDWGCTMGLPKCIWSNTTMSYGCVECGNDAQCGFGTVCEGNTCVQTDDVVCQVNCPTANPAWTEAVIWYGDNLDITVTCGASFAMTQASLCEWGTKNPEFKLNLSDGVWKWGGGVDVTLICNVGAWIRPDPTPSGDPNVTMGDLGVAIVDFETLFCGN